ncbi:MAG: TIGR00282 family metallophosphoesterase, partial [Candidatus Margulisiibacteriota bacterium]
MNILFFGDIVGKIGRDVFFAELPRLKRKFSPDLIIVNGENSANGRGITSKIYHHFLDEGVHCITSGNHVFDNKEILPHLRNCPALIRPINYPEVTPGIRIFTTLLGGTKVAVVSVMGQVFMPPIDNPFHALETLLKNDLQTFPVIIVDFHAEATSEKLAFGLHFAGRVSAVIGTHTHVQTADAEILNSHTGYITDVGMSGAKHAILGMEPSAV